MVSGRWLNTSVGPYRFVEFLGAGGVGEVYRAVHRQNGSVVAVKILANVDAKSTWAQRFLNEARVQAALQHPGVARLFDSADVGGRPCLIMEYVPGETLSDRIRRTGGLGVREAIAIFEPLVDAVAYVHAQGVVHRDLKPANVRITGEGVVKLLDFGIAKGEFTPGLTRTGAVVGTPLYLSPEQLKTGRATAQSDVWALGILLYEMICGRPPYEAQTITDLWDKLKVGIYPAISSVRPPDAETPAWLIWKTDALIGRCLQNEPTARPDSAALLEEVRTAAHPDAGSGVRERIRSVRQAAVRLLSGPGSGAGSAKDSGVNRIGRETVPRQASGAGGSPPRVRSGAPTKAFGSSMSPEYGAEAQGGFNTDSLRALFTNLQSLVARNRLAAIGAAVVAALVLLLVIGLAFRSPSIQTGEMAISRIDVAEGSADIYIDGVFRGRTPFEYRAHVGSRIDLELRQPGFVAYRDAFDVTMRRAWTFRMTRLQREER